MADTMSVQPISGLGALDSDADARRSELSSPRVMASLAISFLVCILVIVAVRISRAEGLVAALWPAGGVAVVGWLRGPRARGFDLAYGLTTAVAFAMGNLLVGNSLPQVAIFTTANMIEVVCAVVLIRRFTPTVDLHALKGAMRFLIAAPVLAPIPAAIFAASLLNLNGWSAFLPSVKVWWMGHALGLAVVAPFGLALTSRVFAPLRSPWKALEAVAIFGVITAACVWTFVLADRPSGYIVTPMVVLAAVRMRLLGVTGATLIVTVAGVLGTIHGQVFPDAHSMPLGQKVELIQLWCLFTCLPLLVVSAVLDERDGLTQVAQEGQARAEAASLGKSRLLANVSHEIKSPVAGIIGIGELWSTGKLGATTPMQEEMADMLVRTARQVEALAYDLLDVAHAEAGAVTVKLQPVDLEATVEDVRRSISMMPEAAGLRWVVEGLGERMTVRADSVRLLQIVTNLVTNAVKYGASGGVVILRLSRPTMNRVRLEVVDKGPGIPLAKQAELFEPFNRLGMEKSTVEGHGIGLALARRLAELQGGAMGFDSRPGEGARFWVELPADQQP